MNNVNRHRLQGLLFAICLSLFPGWISGQNAVLGALSSTDVKLTDHIRVSHTLGEPAVRQIDGQNTIISEGFQQGVWTIRKNPTESNYGLTVYPNPSGNWIHVSTQQQSMPLQTVILQNVNGIEIFRYPIQGDGHAIHVAHLIPGTYHVQGIYSDGATSPAIQLIKQ